MEWSVSILVVVHHFAICFAADDLALEFEDNLCCTMSLLQPDCRFPGPGAWHPLVPSWVPSSGSEVVCSRCSLGNLDFILRALPDFLVRCSRSVQEYWLPWVVTSGLPYTGLSSLQPTRRRAADERWRGPQHRLGIQLRAAASLSWGLRFLLR